MLRAAIEEPDPSYNRKFIEPCVRTFGRARVVEPLLRIVEEGSPCEKGRAASALYWAMALDDGDLGSLGARFRGSLLRAFVETDDLDARRRILPQLRLAADTWTDEERPLVAKAIEIARTSGDPYLKHRVEVQLGAGGPYMALPTKRR
jgi:hypothetical protein